MHIFFELSLILAITTTIAVIMRAMHQPLVVGYLLTGILVGPAVFNLLQSSEQIEVFSKIGISILLFIVGLNLNPDTIKETGRASVVTGLGQIIFTTIMGFLLLTLLGFASIPSMYGAIALTFSSTIIVLKLLSDKGDLGKLYGKLAIGFLLVQDLVATLLLVVVPLVATQASGDSDAGKIFLDLFLKGLGSGIGLYLVSKYLLPRLSFFLAQSQELLFLFSIAWGLGLASFFAWLGFSIEIGALIAGVTLSVSSYAFEISSRMRPLRDFFIVLFFVLLGSQVVITELSSIILPATLLSLFVLIGNPLIMYLLMNMLGYRSRTGFMAGLTVAQISEFSLILMALGFSLGHVDQKLVSLITLVGMITIAGSTYLMLYGDKIYSVLKKALTLIEIRKHPHRERHSAEKNHEMIIFGYGRVGFEFVRSAQKLDVSYVVVDYNPETVANLRGEGVSFRFGDAEDVEFLEEIHLSKAKIVVSTIPDPNVNMLLVRQYREKNSDGVIVVVSHNVPETKSLYLEGASYVVMPHYLGAEQASKMIASHGFDVATFEKARNTQLAQIAAHEAKSIR